MGWRNKEVQRAYYHRNRERIREYHRLHRQRNRERLSRYRKDYRKNNRDRLLELEKLQRQKPSNKKRQRDWQRERQPKDRARVREVVRKLKDVPCADCSKRFPWYVMDFDHVRGKKICEIGSMGNSVTPTKILAEAKKCDVVCACCHRIRSFVTRRDNIPKRRLCK